MAALGNYLKKRREDLQVRFPGYSIRRLAARIGIHHSFLSKIERGERSSLEERRLKALARELGEDPELLMALGGKLPERLTRLIGQSPHTFLRFVQDLESGLSHAEAPGSHLSQIAHRKAELKELARRLHEDVERGRSLEKKIRNDFNRYWTLFNLLPDAAVVADLETGVIFDVNRAAERLWKRSREELAGAHQSTLHPPAGNEERSRMFKMHGSDHLQGEVRAAAVTADGVTVPVLVSASRVECDGRPCVLGIFRDISMLIRAESALRNSEERLKALLQGVQEGPLDWDSLQNAACRQLLPILDNLEAGVYAADPGNGRIVYANRYLTDALGRGVTGQDASLALLRRSGDHGFTRESPGFENIGDTRSAELCFANGRWHMCTARLSPWFDGGRAAVVVAMDITPAREAEMIRADVEQIMRHDLKSPLSGIIAMARLLSEEGSCPEDHAEMLRAMAQSGKHMLALIGSSLRLNRMEADQYELLLEQTDLAEDIRQAETGLADLMRTRNLRVECRTLPGPPGTPASVTARVDRPLIATLFSNLLRNAAEASPRNAAISIRIRPGEMVSIAFHNAGAVPADIRDRFFDKFSTCGKKGGTGLGTYSARLIARAHGGDIAMETSEETGTTVTVTLPGPDRIP
jgi:PAS domain S-box-containing protein